MKVIKGIFILIIGVGLLIGIDMYSIYYRDKPIFADEENGIYKGVLYNTYYCEDEVVIKLKNNKYSCEVKENEIITEETDNKKIAKLTLVGDLLFEQPFYDAISMGDDIDTYFKNVKSYFENDDLSIGNMEVVIGNDDMLVSGTGYNFCAPSYIGDLVSTLDFEVLGTANNHAFDRGVEGINSTIDYFKDTDIVTVGTYKNEKDRNELRILNINGIKFGVFAYTYGTNQQAGDNSNLIGYYKDPSTKELNKNILKEEIEKLRLKSDVVIVLMHWGNEFTYDATKEQKEMAVYLNELGVDIIVGSHSHNIQPIEVIGSEHKTLVYYSLGNFVSHDDDIARTKEGYETFDNAYQVGMISTILIEFENNEIKFNNVETELVINYFDENLRNFELIPYKDYTETYEKTHLRYSKGLTKEFISDMYENVIDKEYRN